VCSLSLHMWDCELLEHIGVNDAIDRFLLEERRSSSSTRSTGTQVIRHGGALTIVLNIASSDFMIRFKHSCFPLALHNMLITNWFVSRLDCA
jgi:hypothetical protein